MATQSFSRPSTMVLALSASPRDTFSAAMHVMQLRFSNERVLYLQPRLTQAAHRGGCTCRLRVVYSSTKSRLSPPCSARKRCERGDNGVPRSLQQAAQESNRAAAAAAQQLHLHSISNLYADSTLSAPEARSAHALASSP